MAQIPDTWQGTSSSAWVSDGQAIVNMGFMDLARHLQSELQHRIGGQSNH
jgi:hypothetical protein